MRSISLSFRSVVKYIVLVLLLTFTGIAGSRAQDLAEGAALFQSKCKSCHLVDRALTGPALKGVDTRHDEAWLIRWVKNAPGMIAAKDPAAVKLYEEYKPNLMSPFPSLSDDNIKNIFAYVKSEEVKVAALPPTPPGDNTADTGVNNYMLLGLIVVILIAFFIILILNRVINTLENLLLEEPELIPLTIEDEERKYSSANLRRLFKNKKFVFFVILLFVIFLGAAGTKGMWDTGVHEGYQPVQPIKFSHQLHAGINQIDCQYCHSGAYKSKNASIPSLNVCMNCHNYVQATETNGGQISPEIQKIYTALDYNPDTKVYGPNQKPVEWIRIHNLPDLAYFNHSQHVSVAGIECQKCHGPIETMVEVYQYSPLTMKWCINCHRETEVNHKDNVYYDQLIAAHEKLKKDGKITAALLGGTECGKCHY